MCLVGVDDHINIEKFRNGPDDGVVGYKVVLRNVETGELKPVYYWDTYVSLFNETIGFRYKVGMYTKKTPESYGIFVLPEIKDCQEWAKVHSFGSDDGLWLPVIVEVIVRRDDVEMTGVDEFLVSRTAVVSNVFVTRIVEHLRR